MHRRQSARESRRREARRLLGADELHVRRHVLQRGRRSGAAREERRSRSFRRSVVRLRALQSDVPRSLRDARRADRAPEGRPDGVRDAFDAQAAGCAVADLLHPHSRRPRRHRSRTLQRGVLLAGEHLAALRADRIERRRRRDDGRSRGTGAHAGNDRRSHRLPSRPRARPAGISLEEGLVLRAVECRGSARSDDGPAHPVSRSARGAARHGSELLGAASRRELARLRRPAGRLVHARPDQVRHRLSGHEDGRPTRCERHSGRHRHRLSRPPRHRAVAHDRSHGAVPVLDGRHEGQVGHAAQHAARLQGRLRPQRAARGSRAARGRGRAATLCGQGPQGSRR